MVGKQAMALFSELDKRSFFYHLRLHYLTTVSIFFSYYYSTFYFYFIKFTNTIVKF